MYKRLRAICGMSAIFVAIIKDLITIWSTDRDICRRVTRQTEVDVGALADRIVLLETATVPGVAADARTVAYQAAYNASITSMDRMNNRMDAMVSQMAGLNAGVAAQLSTLTGQVGTQMAGTWLHGSN